MLHTSNTRTHGRMHGRTHTLKLGEAESGTASCKVLLDTCGIIGVLSEGTRESGGRKVRSDDEGGRAFEDHLHKAGLG